MSKKQNNLSRLILKSVIIVYALFMVGCSGSSAQSETAVSDVASIQTESEAAADMLILPELKPVELNGDRVQVVATTSIIGDVVAQVGRDAINLTVLIAPGQDPHSYQPSAQDLTAVAEAHVVFVNGWNLEESLARDLTEIGAKGHVVPISANIVPLAFGENGHDQDEGGNEPHPESSADPHVWFSVDNVKQWVENVETVLSDLDPANGETYERNAAAYRMQLDELQAYAEAQTATIPESNRFLVTNHDAFGYLAHEFDLTILGTIIPGMSTLAEPSANDLAKLIGEMEKYGVCSLFTETTVSDSLAQTVATELKDCAEVQILQLYTGAVGPLGSGADSYIAMYRANVDTIVAGLQ